MSPTKLNRIWRNGTEANSLKLDLRDNHAGGGVARLSLPYPDFLCRGATLFFSVGGLLCYSVVSL